MVHITSGRTTPKHNDASGTQIRRYKAFSYHFIGYPEQCLCTLAAIYNIVGKYGEKNSDLLFSRMLKHSPFVSCNLHNIKEINAIVKSSYVKIKPLTRSLECEWISKSPLPTNVFDVVNTPLPGTLDTDDSGGNNSCSLSDVAECSTILDKNTPPQNFYLIEILITRQETLGYLASCIYHFL